MSKYAPHRRPANNPRATPSTVCQKCLGTGHYIYECKGQRPYVSRPSRTQLLENPNKLAKLKAAGVPSVEVPEEFKNKWGWHGQSYSGSQGEGEVEGNNTRLRATKKAC
ncbi:hypothetical protein AX16_008018 [Volvariella volvacea WC 439]|nr:hypothetical protein AX16_008018 [Volvariella volvacea WC 439]